MAQDEASAHDHLVCAWGQDRRQGWALDREDRKTLGELYPGGGALPGCPVALARPSSHWPLPSAILARVA